ncbi:hypothetical protein [Saccharothrix obliqua]|uniref:hypothetical protein n=1 Tax=Saccharothrix obliqua TaxID=2861747 RepID=UPI001C60463C|nr:hypothetical protein [Saccharothrix obliqua]MBW4715920.1 hypothetical protein [Saccharothrix obliqua]
MTSVKELSGRERAMLRAVAAGRGRLSGEPVLYVDGLRCCDQMAAHDLVDAGLLRPGHAVGLEECAAAVLTEAGRAAIA